MTNEAIRDDDKTREKEEKNLKKFCWLIVFVPVISPLPVVIFLLFFAFVVSLNTIFVIVLTSVLISCVAIVNIIERESIWKKYGGIIVIFVLAISFSVAYDSTMNIVYAPDEPFAEWEVIPIVGFEETTFRDIEFINRTHGWLVGIGFSGARRAILHTTDGGVTWSSQYEDGESDFYSVSVVAPNDIWVGSERDLFHSSDGGRSWNDTSIPSNFPIAVEFYNTTYGLAGSHAGMYVTTDGGMTWRTIADWPDEHPDDICITPTKIRIATDLGLHLSTDAGVTWAMELTKSTEAISFVDDNLVWIAHYGSISRFDGATWTEYEGVSRLSNYIRPGIKDIEFLDENNGWTAGRSPAIAHTADGGQTWYDHLPDENFHLLTFDTVNDSYCWAAGWDGVVLRTTTGNLFGPKLVRGFYLGSFGFGSGGRTIPYEPLMVASCLSISFGVVAIYMWRKHR